jgi:hypothetical protein
VGVQFSASGATFTNTSAVSGANGGAGGAANGGTAGSAGNGGAGIAGSGLTVVNSGTITGGLANAGSGARANAVSFTGGTNVLELESGSTITGNVVASSSADTLELGGSANASFDVSQIAPGAQYQGFGVFEKAGTNTWTLTGTGTSITNWTVTAGTLAVGSGAIVDGTVTVDSGATLTCSGTITGAVTVNSGGTLSPGCSPSTGVLRTDGVSMNSSSTFAVSLDGTTAGTGYDQLAVNGAVSLGSAALAPTLGFSPTLGQVFTIILNLGGGAVSGTFAGLPEGSVFSVGGVPMKISYVGGSGDDVTLTVVQATPTITTIPGGTVAVGGGTPLTDGATLAGGNAPGGTITFYLFAPGVTPNGTDSNNLYSDVVTVSGNGTYTTAAGTNPGGYSPTTAGTYQWVAVYSGDTNNNAVASAFGSEPETVFATASPLCSGTIPAGQNAVGIAATPDDGGYWIATNTGAVIHCGDAQNFGQVAETLNAPIVGITATHDGNGFYLVAADGGVFTFGDAVFLGSMGAVRLNKPVVGMALDPATGGYWLVAADGGVFTFKAPFFGSMGNQALNKPVVGMETDSSGDGYRLVGADGGIFDFGSSQFKGSAA